MTTLGKVFTVLIFIMSILFMGFSSSFRRKSKPTMACVRNWTV